MDLMTFAMGTPFVSIAFQYDFPGFAYILRGSLYDFIGFQQFPISFARSTFPLGSHRFSTNFNRFARATP
jgi:hypothetical protein